MNEEKKRANDLAQLKGASAWLTSLPIKDEGFVLNKREFFDAVAMRYRWDMKRLPLNCSCGKQFTMDHAMQCPLGGYVIRRHDQIRDLFASLLNDVANDVRIEPSLQPLTGEILNRGANLTSKKALSLFSDQMKQARNVSTTIESYKLNMELLLLLLCPLLEVLAKKQIDLCQS